MAASSNMKRDCHVFLSFRGTDVRQGFLSHLYAALDQRGIHTFVDREELRKGEQISLALMRAIEESRIAIIVFSEDYASSSWCLEEAVKIMECKERMGLIVFPVFYKVEPREVRAGRQSYGRAMAKHESKFGKNSEKVKRWKKALLEAGSLSGWELNDRDEADLIQCIVKELSIQLDRTPLHVAKYPIGIDSQVQKLIWLSQKESADDDVLMIGLWGPGGIGKTTIAKALYNAMMRQFQGCSFLEQVREKSNQSDGLVTLQKDLLSEILVHPLTVYSVTGGISLIQERLCHKKVLLVLDDVDLMSQLNALAGKGNWFGKGSRIIVTTRDKQLLTSHGINCVYEIQTLGSHEAHDLFSLCAFPNSKSTEIRKDLIDKALHYADGLPLALEVLGSFLCGRKEPAWESTLHELSKIPEPTINRVLKISFDGLENNEREIFLDIACFFKGKRMEYIQEVLDSCDFNTTIGIEILIERSLIKNENGSLQMHDLVQLMGMDIVKQECCDDPGKRSRLWLLEDVEDIFCYNTGTDAVKAIVLDLPSPEVIIIGPDAFTNMKKLRILILLGVHISSQAQVRLPNELSWLEWPNAPYLDYGSGPNKLLNKDVATILGNLADYVPKGLLRLLVQMAHMKEKRQVASMGKNVGTVDQVNDIMSLMNIDAKDQQRVVVIHGEAGIGKTTLAKLIYNQVSWDFDGCSFLADIAETTQELGGLQLLQTRLISDVLKRDFEDVAFISRGIEFFRDSFCNMRVLIVLDDVENVFHVEKLIGDGFDCFASGSRILITTRNNAVLEQSLQIRAYHVSRLDKNQALQLLRRHASIPISLEIFWSALNCMAGLPLFIEVMGAVLNGSLQWRWSQLPMEPMFGQQNFHCFLKKVYQRLDYKQKQIFLDIACFTTGIYSRIAWYLWYDSSFLPSSKTLTPLAKIGENNQIWMHSMLRQFGREIVFGENLTDPGSRSRLFNHEIALDTIKRKKGTEKVEALCLNFQGHTSNKLLPEDFESMPNLRFLQLDHADIAGDFAELFPNLRWLRWRGCPRHIKVTNFHLGNLTILDLSWSKVTKDWEGWDQIEMKKLRVLDLTGCVDLFVTPKFSACKNLAILILERCSQLVKIDHSISDLKCLVSLNLRFCRELSMLPVEVGCLTTLQELLMDGTSVQEIPISIGHLEQLNILSASNCFSLSQLPRTMCHLTNISLLSLDGTRIAALPDSIGELVRLKHLSLRDCRRIRKLPNSIDNIGRSLVELDVSGTGISKFPDSLKMLQNLKVLRMDSSLFRKFPPDIKELTSLEELHASWCQSLEGGIPSEIGKLHNLRTLRLRHSTISSIPVEIHQLSNLQTLDLLHCDMIEELPRLPSSITVLYVDDKLKLMRLP